MKITLFQSFTLLMAFFGASLFVSCKKTHVTPAPPVDSLKVGLLAYYTLDNTGADSSGNKYDGTVYDINSAPDRFGNANGAYYFNGVSSYITIPDNPSIRLNQTDFTLNAWVKTNDYGNSYQADILAKRATGANNGWVFCLLGGAVSPTGVMGYGPGGGSINAYGTTAVSLNQWHMLTVVYTLSKLQTDMYIDGGKTSTVTGTYTGGVFGSSSSGVVSPNASISEPMYIGRDDMSIAADYFFNGSMDDIRIYSRAISQKQIQQLFSATK